MPFWEGAAYLASVAGVGDVLGRGPTFQLSNAEPKEGDHQDKDVRRQSDQYGHEYYVEHGPPRAWNRCEYRGHLIWKYRCLKRPLWQSHMIVTQSSTSSSRSGIEPIVLDQERRDQLL